MPVQTWNPLELITAARLNAMVPVGPFEYFIPALAWHPGKAYWPCGNHERVRIDPSSGEVWALPFDALAIEVARCSFALPAAVNEAASIGVRLYWLNKAGGSGTVEWQFHWGGYGYGQFPTAGMGPGPGLSSAALGALVLIEAASAGTPPSPALDANMQFWLQVSRSATTGTDTYPADAYFLGAKLTLTFDDTVDG